VIKFSNQWYKLRASLRRRAAKSAGVTLGSNVRIAKCVDFNLSSGFHRSLRPDETVGRILIGDGGWIEQGAVLWAFDGHIELAANVFVGPYSVIYGHGGVTIGEHTLISQHCSILSSNHGIPPVGKLIRDQPDVRLPTRIGRDCWIGAGTRILGGVTIGDGCVVGAGAVVTKDLAAGAIAFGTPATVRRYRTGES